MLPTRLVFCGGGTRCLIFLQTLVELEQRKHLNHVREYWGTSAGAFLAALLAVSKSATTVKQLMMSVDYIKFRDIDVGNLINITRTWGMDDGTSMITELERTFERIEVGASEKCMADVVGLHVVVADLTAHETVVVNSDTHPKLRIVDAIRASMSLPLMFRPYIHPPTGHYWVDGAIRAHFPWDMLPNDTARAESLGFAFEKSWAGGPQSFSDYIYSMIHFDEPKKIAQQKASWASNIIWYPPPPYPAWFVRLRDEDFRLIDDIGRAAAERWFTLQVPPVRRPETPPLCDPPCTPASVDPLHQIDGNSDIPKPCITPDPDAPQHQLPCTRHVSRRWSV